MWNSLRTTWRSFWSYTWENPRTNFKEKSWMNLLKIFRKNSWRNPLRNSEGRILEEISVRILEDKIELRYLSRWNLRINYWNAWIISVGVSRENLWNPIENSLKKSLEELLGIFLEKFLGNIWNISWKTFIKILGESTVITEEDSGNRRKP